jgi:hypothetical protein
MKNLTAARDAVGSEEPIATGGWCFYKAVDSAELIVDSGKTPFLRLLSTINHPLLTH